MHTGTGLPQALAMARKAAREIRRAESQAHEALHAKGDPQTHRFKMIEKCGLLADLAETTTPLLENGGEKSKALLAGLKEFARKANMALNLESIFFMTALLYPENYTDGDPNDLERFLDTFEDSPA